MLLRRKRGFASCHGGSTPLAGFGRNRLILLEDRYLNKATKTSFLQWFLQELHQFCIKVFWHGSEYRTANIHFLLCPPGKSFFAILPSASLMASLSFLPFQKAYTIWCVFPSFR
jgi:hypothetical protein